MAAFPFLQRLLYHYYFQILVRTFSAATVGNTLMQRWINQICLKHLADSIPNPVLRAKLTPDYQATCKRLIFCSDYYPALSRANAYLITDAITQVEPRGI